MSRSSLNHKEKLRAYQEMEGVNPSGTSEPTERTVKANELPMWGNERTFNLNTLLYNNILQSSYFKALYNKRTYHEVVDEIYYKVDHAEPLSPGTSRVPSTCFCLLVKFCTMRVTTKQMNGLLTHVDSPFIRCVGFLYLRYTYPPEKLWEYFEPYLEDTEEFYAASDHKILTTIGKWIRGLLEDHKYFGTLLPRLPKKISDDIKVKLLLLDKKVERRAANNRFINRFSPGNKVRAMYADEDHEPAMYDAVIDSVEDDGKYWVTFPEYGNREKVDLGDMEILDSNMEKKDARRSRRSRSRSREHHSRRYDRSRSRDRDSRYSRDRQSSRSRDRKDNLSVDLLEQVREREREQAQAVGKEYSQRPATYKGSLTMKVDRYTTRKRSRSRSFERYRKSDKPRRRYRSSSRSPERPSPPRAMSENARERQKKLLATYGDASSSRK